MYTIRCPAGVQTRRDASPRVMSQRMLGGVDQATLRQSLSGHDDTLYLQDSELWRVSDALRRLESLQLDIVSTDIQVPLRVREGERERGREGEEKVCNSCHINSHCTFIVAAVTASFQPYLQLCPFPPR